MYTRVLKLLQSLKIEQYLAACIGLVNWGCVVCMIRSVRLKENERQSSAIHFLFMFGFSCFTVLLFDDVICIL